MAFWKKIMTFALAGILAVQLGGCGGGEAQDEEIEEIKVEVVGEEAAKEEPAEVLSGSGDDDYLVDLSDFCSGRGPGGWSL